MHYTIVLQWQGGHQVDVPFLSANLKDSWRQGWVKGWKLFRKIFHLNKVFYLRVPLIRTCCLSHWDRCGKSSKGILFIVHAARLEIFNFVQDKKLLLFMPYILPFLCFKLGYLLTPPMLFNSLNRHVLLHNLHYICPFWLSLTLNQCL